MLRLRGRASEGRARSEGRGVMGVVHRCQWCDRDYPCLNERDREDHSCDCAETDTCPECSDNRESNAGDAQSQRKLEA
jgi:hypothetical protein